MYSVIFCQMHLNANAKTFQESELLVTKIYSFFNCMDLCLLYVLGVHLNIIKRNRRLIKLILLLLLVYQWFRMENETQPKWISCPYITSANLQISIVLAFVAEWYAL